MVAEYILSGNKRQGRHCFILNAKGISTLTPSKAPSRGTSLLGTEASLNRTHGLKTGCHLVVKFEFKSSDMLAIKLPLTF